MQDINTLITLFKNYAGTQRYANAFDEFLDWVLIPFKKNQNDVNQEKALETYKSHPKIGQLVALITLVGDLSEGFCDPLGELFMRVVSNGQNGQYFTPEPVCEAIGRILLDPNEPISGAVGEPTCGSGRMILAAAKINRFRTFYAADIDLTCCKMCLLNMLLNSLTGEVCHMDALSNQFYHGFKTATIIVDGFHHPYFEEFTDPEQSHQWLRPTAKSAQGFSTPFEPTKSTAMDGVQGNLFDQL